jgi:hypothetical protein
VSLKNKQKNVTVHWLYKYCYTAAIQSTPNVKVTPQSGFLTPANPTNGPQRHLERIHHYQSDGTLSATPRKKRTIQEAFDLIETSNKRVFDRKGWQTIYTRWIACSGISLRQATSDDLYDLLTFNNPQLTYVVPRTVSTAREWIIDSYNKNKAKVIKSIATSISKLTISFDGWKANNDVLDLLGVVLHYLRDDHKLHNVVLVMRDTLGSHTGSNIADHLFNILKDYQISGNQIAYFAADNATNNDKALKLLSERVTLDPVTSRLRCAGHMFNLVYTAILFGVDKESLEDAQYDFSQEQIDDDLTSGTQAVTSLETTLQYGSEEQQH